MKTLEEIGLNRNELRVIRNLYWDQKATVQVGETIEIKKGVRQGCIFSPDLFSLYSQSVMDELEGLVAVKVGGRNINNMRYVDDTVLVPDTKDKLR